jgi:multidrug efflux system membrane fusion protein
MKIGVVAGSAALALSVVLVLPRMMQPTTPAVAADTPVPAAPATPPGIPVVPGTVTAADVPVLLNAIGTVQAYNMVTIKSRVDGQIQAIKFDEGQNIEAGAPLIQIDPRPFQATLEQLQAVKQKDEAQLAGAMQDLERYGQLVGPGYQTRQSYDQQKATVAQLQAAIKGDEANIDNARLNLGFTDIRSPISGRLGARLVDIGNMVRATDAAGLVTVAQIKPIFVTFTVAQEFAHKVRERQDAGPLEVRAYGHDNATLLATGKLTLIDNAIDQASGTIRMKANFGNADERLWPGEFVNVRLITNMRKNVPTVPAPAVQDGPKGQYAYVIKDDNTVERRAVEVAVVQDGVAVITKGLSPGEKVVIDGQYRLTQGSRVRTATPTQPSQQGTAG